MTDQECNSMVADLVAGVPGVKEKLILGNTWLAEVWAIRTCKKHRVSESHYPDFIGQGYLILVKSIDRLASGEKTLKDGNLRGYLAQRLRNLLPCYLSSMDVVSVDYSTIKRWRAAGKNKKRERTVNFTKTVIDICKTGERADAGLNLADIQSLIRKVVQHDPVSQRLVELRIEGKTDAEIGAELGYTQQGISILRSKIAARLKSELER